MTDIKSEISQKELFKQYLASRGKLDKQMPIELIKKYEHKQEINKQYNNKLKQRYIDDLEYKKKRLENQKKYYYEKKKPKNEELKKLKIKELEQAEPERLAKSLRAGLSETSEPEAQPQIEPEAQPQIEEKRQSKKMNDLHNLFNRHLFV
jgi:hypothetical protein